MSERQGRERTFVATAAHELRTPAAAIHGLASTLVEREGLLEPEQVVALHEMLLLNSHRLVGLIDELLDLSRVDADAVALDPVALDVRARVAELAAGAGVEVVNDVPDGLRAVIDLSVFDRVVGNLLANAVKHGRPPVVVAAALGDGTFRLTVEDHGEGVPEEFVPHLFERFTRSPKAARPGAGLGLAIAAAYAAAHGGTLSYEAATPQGARFVLLLAGQ